MAIGVCIKAWKPQGAIKLTLRIDESPPSHTVKMAQQ